MDDIHDRGNRLCDKRDLFRITLRKNIVKPINYHFSLKQIQCQGCGSSFDATKQKFCTNCGRRYEVGDEDWIVTGIERR